MHACIYICMYNGQLHVAQWLLNIFNIDIDIDIDNDIPYCDFNIQKLLVQYGAPYEDLNNAD